MGPVVPHSNIAEGLDQWPKNMPLGVQPTMQELTGAIRSLANGKAVEPDEVSVELFKITLNGASPLRRRLLDVVGFYLERWRGAHDGGYREYYNNIPVLCSTLVGNPMEREPHHYTSEELIKCV